MSVARSSGVAVVRRFSSSSSPMSSPSRVRLSTALSAIDQTWLRSSSSPRTSRIRARCSGPRRPRRGRRSSAVQADLLGGGGLVDRHAHGPGEPDRVVEQGPLVAGLGDQGDAVADLDPGGDEALGHRADLGQELGRGDVLPGAAVGGGPAEGHDAGRLAGVGHDVVGEVSGRRDLGRQRGRTRAPGKVSRGGGARAIRYARSPSRPRAVHEPASSEGSRWPSRPPRSSSTLRPPRS